MRNEIVKRSFKPAEPKFRFVQEGKYLITYATVNPAPGVVQVFRSRVDLAALERRFRNGNINEESIEGIFGDIFKGVKKAVKKVGKAIGIKKIGKVFKKIAKLPGISAIPFVGSAIKAIDVGTDVASALLAKKQGKKKLAKKALALASRTAQSYGMSNKEAMKAGQKIYRLIISPE
jgi:hypothetical protein